MSGTDSLPPPESLAPGSLGAESLVLHLEGFEGPLDLLLDLARGQKLDLARISILSLVEQFLAVVEGARRVRLEIAADWLVMAAWLAWLKSRLLLPAGSALQEEAEADAEVLAARLRELHMIRQAAAWLAARPVLGQDVFRRGCPEDLVETDRSRIALDMPALMRAYLAALRRAGASQHYRPAAVTLWSIQQALVRLAELIGRMPDWTGLEKFLPPLRGTRLQNRAALASILVAGLEMARSGQLRLRQEEQFGPILVRARDAESEEPPPEDTPADDTPPEDTTEDPT